MIWVPPEAPSTVSWTSSRTTGRELTKSGISRGRLPLGVVLGSSSFCAGSTNSSERPRRIGSPSDSSKALSSSWTAVSDCNADRVGTVALWVVHWPWFCVLTFVGFGAAILDWLSCVIADLTRASSILARVSSSSNFKFSFWSLVMLAADCFSSSDDLKFVGTCRLLTCFGC